MQQRGICPVVVDLILNYGERAHAARGREIFYLGKRGRQRVCRYEGAASLRRLEGHWWDSVVVSRDGQVVTCCKGHRRIRRK